MSDCEENFCQNNGTCIKYVLTVTCLWEPAYVGSFCQDKGLNFMQLWSMTLYTYLIYFTEPPFHIQPKGGTQPAYY